MMEQLPIFQYFIVVNDKEYLLPQSPDGWEDTRVEWKKDVSNYWGNNQEFSLPFNFVLEAAKYFRKILYVNGIDAICRFRVKKLDPRTESYFVEYEGDLDFSEASDTLTGFELNIMDDGLMSKIKAVAGTDFEIDFNESIDVRVPGVDIVQYANIFVAGNNIFVKPYIFVTALGDYNIPLGTFDVFDQQEDSQDSYNFTTYSNYFLETNDPKPIQLSGYFKVDLQNYTVSGRKAYWNVILCDSSTASGGDRVLLYTSFDLAARVPLSVEFNINHSFTGVAGRKYFLVLEFYTAGGIFGANTIYFNVTESQISVTSPVTTDPVIVKALRPNQVFQRLMDKISLGSTAQSYLLSQKNDVITSGDAIRGLPNPILKTSFTAFYKSMDALYCAGMDINKDTNTAIIEGREYFFRREFVIADLGEVKDCTFTPYTDLLGSELKIGYSDFSYETERGRFEFNSDQQFTTTSKRVTRSLDLKSIYRADQFGIEELRIKQLEESESNATETDNKWDNSVFVLRIKSEPGLDGIYDMETAEDYQNVEGVVSRTSTYNIGLSPKTNLLNHIKFIASSFFGDNENGNIQFASSTKNADLRYTKDDVTVVEKDPIYIRDITSQSRVFLPFLADFTAKYPKSLQQLIKSSPYGCVRFSWLGKNFRGYIIECSVDITKDTEQEFKLLLTPDNDLSNLY